MEFEREHDLPYSPEQIWAVLGDFENHRIWNPYVRIERLAEDPIAIRYSMRMDPHKPKFLEVSATVLSARAGEELKEFHQGLAYVHGGQSCLSCHNAANYDTKVLMWQTLIHIAFLFSALAIALTDRLLHSPSADH